MQWYFTVTSDEFGSEDYGPYDTEQEAQAGIDRVAEKAIELNDDVDRHFTRPYQKAGGLMEAVIANSDQYGIGIVDLLDLLTDFLGFGDTGVQDRLPEGATVKALQEALVELYEKTIGRR